MNSRSMMTAVCVFFLFFLFAVFPLHAGDGKVTMEEWIRIINSGKTKKSSPPPADENKSTGIKSVDAASSAGGRETAVTIYWHMADDADVYLNGKPLRNYDPSFKTRPDEAPRPAFSAAAVIKNGDVFTVGGRRGGSFGFMLIAVDASNNIVFMTDQQSWKVYEPGERPDWYTPAAAADSLLKPVTIQPDPWPPQKELNARYGNKALSIWSSPANTFAYLFGVVGGIR